MSQEVRIHGRYFCSVTLYVGISNDGTILVKSFNFCNKIQNQLGLLDKFSKHFLE